MILPDKNIKLEYSLLNCGALILSEITEPQTISSLWDKSKKCEILISYEKFLFANCKCKLDTCTVEQSESERWSGWRPLASILGDAAAAFGCVNRVEELVKQFLRGTVAQFLARPSI